MCNCGHDELNRAKELKRGSINALLLALFFCVVVFSIGKGHPPVVFVGAGSVAGLLGATAWMMLRRRRLLCGEAR